ncbi:HNH endonuclease [Burkholderia gladioli]
MQDFSRLIATIHDRQFTRPNYWPVWLKKAIFYRDHGRCGICNCDLTGLIAIDKEIHIDHMVPISLFGTNDPTNLQILCDSCNLKKGNRSADTSSIRHAPWKL